jgi:5-methylthioadenosine/S-adenosylhomocysteine deaminase
MPATIDTLIDADWIIPVEPFDQTLSRHSIAIQDGNILAILPTADAHREYHASSHYRLEGHALIPGLVNLHTHSPMTLLRGLADDMALMEWLNQHIWPAEGRHVSPEFVKDGTLLACAEMLRSGTTCFNDMYFFPEASCEAVASAKMRATIGLIAIEFPTAYASHPDDYFDKGLAARDAFRDEPLLNFALAPHAPYTVSDKTFEKVLTWAEQLDLPVHIHVHETTDEISGSLQQHSLRPLDRLQRLGLLGPHLIAVHAVHLNPGEIATLARQGCHIAHCPASNLKLASGFSPVSSLLESGINVGIGTDGAASNNNLDMLGELRMAALLAKGQSNNAAAVSARQALRMATLNGARALGLDHRIGSLLPGKAADITAIDLRSPETSPCYHPESDIVYSAGRENVSHVWVNGQILLRDRQLTTLDLRDIQARAARWREKIREE